MGVVARIIFFLFVFLKGYIMEEILSALVGAVNLVLWDYLLIYALIGNRPVFYPVLGRTANYQIRNGFQIRFRRLVQ